MCSVRLLIVSDNDRYNQQIIDAVTSDCLLYGGPDIVVIPNTIKSCLTGLIDPDNYDLVIAETILITTKSFRAILGSGVPILTFDDIRNRNSQEMHEVVSNIMQSVVASCGLMEHIEEVTSQVAETHKLILSF